MYKFLNLQKKVQFISEHPVQYEYWCCQAVYSKPCCLTFTNSHIYRISSIQIISSTKNLKKKTKTKVIHSNFGFWMF